MGKPSSKRVLVKNKRALFDYDIQKKYLAGIVLSGAEVKSVRFGTTNMSGGFIRVENGEVWLYNACIKLWKYSCIKEYDPRKRRKLLLTKREISELSTFQNIKKMSIVPLEIVADSKMLKLLFGVGKGRRKYDKKAKIKEREMKREVRADLARKKVF